MSYLHLSPLRSVFLRVAAIILVLLAMLRDGRCGVDRLVRYPAHLEVILMLGIEFLPVFNALCSIVRWGTDVVRIKLTNLQFLFSQPSQVMGAMGLKASGPERTSSVNASPM